MSSLPSPPEGAPFSVVLADPAWPHKVWSDKGAKKSASQHYDTMTLEQIRDIPVKDWVAKDAVLFIWVTWPLLPQIFEAKIIESWGFHYSSLGFEWRKWNRETGKFKMGCGYTTRKSCEPCIIARRGKPYVFDRGVRDFLDSAPESEPIPSGLPDQRIPLESFLDARHHGHSVKPKEQYEIIERLFDGPYLEMFYNRYLHPGWSGWGYGEHVKTPIEP